MTKVPILLLGAGGHARACIDVIEEEGRFGIAGLVGLPEQVGSKVLGYPVVGTEADLPVLSGSYSHALIVVGQINTPDLRMRLFNLLEQGCWTTPLIVSPRAHASRHATLGAGTIVMHGVVVNAGAVVGRNCIINNQALVEHDAVIGDHCHVATAAIVNGDARVGAGTFIGSGSGIRNGITLGERCLIGMGQQVLKNCDAGTRMPPRKPA